MTIDTDIAPMDAYDALRLLQQAVTLRGRDFLYRRPGTPEDGLGCFYVHGDEPGCIVGLVMHLHGVPIEEIHSWDGRGTIYTLHLNGQVPFLEENAMKVLRAAQSKQDAKVPWGEAVAYAEGIADALWGRV